jgi:hypothetical protein
MHHVLPDIGVRPQYDEYIISALSIMVRIVFSDSRKNKTSSKWYGKGSVSIL